MPRRVLMLKRIVLHPFIFAIFPIVSMLSTNIGDALPREALWPCLLAEGIAIALWLALWPLLPNPHQRGFLVTLFWLPFYGYGAAVDALRSAFDFRAMLGPAQVALVALLAVATLATLVYTLRRWNHPFTQVTAALNTMALVTLLLAVGAGALSLYKQQQFRETHAEAAVEHVAVEGDPLAYPDVYYVILDAYTRGDYLKSLFNHDNEPFLNALRNRGFYVADRSRSNYIFTLLSLSSSMNMDFVSDDIAEQSLEDWNQVKPMLATTIWDSAVVNFFKARGYEFVTFATWLAAFEIRTADRFIEPDQFRLTAFHHALIDATPIRSVLNRMDRSRVEFPFLFALDKLGHVERKDKPLFVFAHVLGPHLPHVVDAEGNHLSTPPPYLEGYSDEVTYINKKVLEIVDAIQMRQPNSIIVFQGDHGPRSNWRSEEDAPLHEWEGTEKEYIRDRTLIFNAYYFPRGDYENLYPEITPVNTFRMILNTYFGTGFERLDDVSIVHMSTSNTLKRVEEVY